MPQSAVPPPGSASKRTHINCVTLRTPATRIGEAEQIAHAIARACTRSSTDILPISVGDDEVGQLFAFRKPAAGTPWHPLGVMHGGLAGFAASLVSGLLQFDDLEEKLQVPITTLEELITVGPTHHLIGHAVGNKPIGAFEFHETVGGVDNWGADRSMWKADSKTQTTLVVQPTHKGSAPQGVGSDSDRAAMRQYRSTLFYARNMRWTSQKLLAGMTRRQVHGGRAWTALLHSNVNVRKAFALWANSTLGMISHWTQGQRTQAGRSTTQIAALKAIPCPDLSQLDDSRLTDAAAEFDGLCQKPLLPACQAHADPVRCEIDRVVVRMLSLSSGAAAAIPILRWLWCNEPSVHARNRTALRKIREAAPGRLL